MRITTGIQIKHFCVAFFGFRAQCTAVTLA